MSARSILLHTRILERLKKDPELTYAQLSERFGVTVAHLTKILAKHRIKPGPGFDGFKAFSRRK